MKIELPVIEIAGTHGHKITLLPDGAIFYRKSIIFHDDIDSIDIGDFILFDDIDRFMKYIEQDDNSEIVVERFKEMVSTWKSVFDGIGE